jgi:hypothetical protein
MNEEIKRQLLNAVMFMLASNGVALDEITGVEENCGTAWVTTADGTFAISVIETED